MYNEKSKTFFVGLVTLCMMAIIAALLIWQSDIFRKISGYQVVGRFAHIGGLIDGAAVRYRGYSVGHVLEFHPQAEYIDVVFFVDGHIQIPIGSQVKILFDGLVGENYVQIEPLLGQKEFVKDNDILYGTSGSDLANFIDLGSQNLMHTESILMAVQKIVSDKQLLGDLKDTIKNLSTITSEIALVSQSKEVNSLLSNASVSMGLLKHLLETLSTQENLDSIQDIIKSLRYSTQSLTQIDSLISSVSKQDNVKKVESILHNIDRASSDLSLLLGSDNDDPSFLSQLTRFGVDANTHVMYSSQSGSGYFDTFVEVSAGKYALIGGVGNQSGSILFQHFQQSYRFSDWLRGRFGILYNAEGVGVDLVFTNKWTISANFYDFTNTYYRISSGYTLYKDLQLELAYRRDSQVSRSVDVGVNLGI